MNNNKLLSDAGNAGAAFTLSAVIPLLLSFIFLITLQLAANLSAGASGAEQLFKAYQNRNWFKYMSFLISQIAFFAVILYFAKVKKVNVASNFKRFEKKYIAAALILSFGLIFGLSRVNYLFIEMLERAGLNVPEVKVPVIDSLPSYFSAIAVIAVLPALLEELLFRGIILNGTCGKTVGAALISGAMFALFHQNPAQTVYQFISGALFAVLTLRAKSVIPAVLMHFINNAYVLTAYAFFPGWEIKGAALTAVTAAGLICAVALAVYLVFFAEKTQRTTDKAATKKFFMYSMPGIVICAVMWIAGLFL